MDSNSETPKPVVVEATTAATEVASETEPTESTAVPNGDEEIENQNQEKRKDGIKGILSTIAILVIAPLIALTLTIFVFQSYQVDGPSMESTLQNNDRLIVYKLPRTISRITGHPYVPKRADIVIFSRQDSYEFGTSKPRQLIKRVIALPGERVVVKNGVITVYNEKNPNGFQPDKIGTYGKVIKNTAGDIDLTVPDDSIYVCGDNRPESLDSRSFGPVPLKDLVGKLALRVYPFGKGEVF